MKLNFLLLLTCSLALASNPEKEHQLPPDKTHTVHVYNKTIQYFQITTTHGNHFMRPMSESILSLEPQKVTIIAYAPLDFTHSRPLNQREKSISKYTKKLLLYPSDHKYGWQISSTFFPW